MIQVGKRVGSYDTSGKEGGITRYKWERGWDHMIQVVKRVGSHDTSGKEGGITIRHDTSGKEGGIT